MRIIHSEIGSMLSVKMHLDEIPTSVVRMFITEMMAASDLEFHATQLTAIQTWLDARQAKETS